MSHRLAREFISLLRYILRLWPLLVLFVLAQAMMWLTGNSVLLRIPHWLSLLDFVLFLLVFGLAASWAYWPMIVLERRGKGRARQGRLVESVMAQLPLRSLRAFILAGAFFGSYLLLVLLGSVTASGESVLSSRMILSLIMAIYFGAVVLIPALAFATTIQHELGLRLVQGSRGVFMDNMDDLRSLHYFTDSSRRPWLVFFVTGLVPTALLATQAWLAAESTNSVEQHFIASQGLVLFVVHILASTYLIFLVSRSLNLVTRELAKGLKYMREGYFEGRVSILVDDDLGELAKGLNTALQGLQEREDLKDSLKIAAEIQQGLLPDALPDVPGYNFCAFEESCYAVGGDYYDFIPLSDGRIWLVIADVAGKGYPAALTVANLQAMLHVLAAENVRFDKAVDYINRALCKNLSGGRFVTLFMAKLQPKTHSLLWLNAGHTPPLLHTASGVQHLNAASPPLGMVPEIGVRPQRVELHPGDLLLAYTDGVTEAHDAKGLEMFGEGRLTAWFAANHKLSPKALQKHLLQTLDQFAKLKRSTGAGSGREDDLTLLCLQRKEG